MLKVLKCDWRRMKKISWTERVKNEVKVGKEYPTCIEWIGNILDRNCLLNCAIEGKAKGKRRLERRGKQLLDDLN